jgi:hypothetical protein
MPKDFGIKWIVWLMYTNAVSIIMTLQLIFLYLSADNSIPQQYVHWCLGVANILGIVVAQIKNRFPVPPRPLRKKVKYG